MLLCWEESLFGFPSYVVLFLDFFEVNCQSDDSSVWMFVSKCIQAKQNLAGMNKNQVLNYFYSYLLD